MFKSHPFQKFHHDERMTILLSDLMDRADVRMVQRGCSPRLTAESFERLLVLGEVFGQELQSDEAAKFGVFSFVNDTHPPTSQLLDDAVVGDGLADKLRRSSH